MDTDDHLRSTATGDGPAPSQSKASPEAATTTSKGGAAPQSEATPKSKLATPEGAASCAKTKAVPEAISNGGGGNGGRCSFDASNAEKTFWLLRCPSPISSAFPQPSSSAADSSSSLSSLYDPPPPPRGPSRPTAKVVVSVDPFFPDYDCSSTQFTLELAGDEFGNAPKIHTMKMFNNIKPMLGFSESSQGRLSVEGKIPMRFYILPCKEDFDSYGKLCRARANTGTAKTRQIQIIRDNQGQHLRPSPGTVGTTSRFGNQDKKDVLKKIRSRMIKEELEDLLFKLFEEQETWRLKHLVQRTNQPKNYLREVLKELCFYNKTGANRGTHELKPR